jgi:hypothetical protein
MKLIDYGKYEKWSQRQAIWMTVADVFTALVFIGISLVEAVRGREASTWLFPLAVGFASGAGALQPGLIASHKRKLAASTGQKVVSSL